MIRVLLAILWSACLMVACYNTETSTPYYAIEAIFFAFVLGGLIVDTANHKGGA